MRNIVTSLTLIVLSFSSLANSSFSYQLSLSQPDGNPAASVVVYLEPQGHQLKQINQQTVIIGQRDKAFVPYISVAQRGSQVDFNNDDNITHHIYSAAGDNKFSFQIKSGETHSKHDFDHSGVVPMGCNIHDWMGAYLLLVDTPLFNKTDAQGMVKFTDVPAGDYQLVVWHPELKTANQQLSQKLNINYDGKLALSLPNALEDEELEQQNPDDFDFLSEY
ncbi:methylamine utilization protein [Agarivorans albus]